MNRAVIMLLMSCFISFHVGAVIIPSPKIGALADDSVVKKATFSQQNTFDVGEFVIFSYTGSNYVWGKIFSKGVGFIVQHVRTPIYKIQIKPGLLSDSYIVLTGAAIKDIGKVAPREGTYHGKGYSF